MTYELPRLEDGSVDWRLIILNIVGEFIYAKKNEGILKAIDANARAEERECIAKHFEEFDGSDVAELIRNLGDKVPFCDDDLLSKNNE